MRERWERRGATASQRMSGEELLRDRHPLLANWGRLGREMARLIEESDAITHEEYILPDHAAYEESVVPGVRCDGRWKEIGLLDGLKCDWVGMRTGDVIEIREEIPSIQLHHTSSPKREVQVVHEQIVQLLDRGIEPKDIVVMMPNVTKYEPLIRTVFGESEVGLRSEILDLPMREQSQAVQVLQHLITLAKSRWEASQVLSLYEYPLFQRSQKWKREDVLQIREWIRCCGILWGEDGEHRKQLLAREHGHQAEEMVRGTWKEGIDKLLDSLLFSDEEFQVDISDLDLLNQFLTVQSNLKIELNSLISGEERLLSEWSEILCQLCRSYLSSEEEDVEELIRTLQSLGGIDDAKFSFLSVERYLEKLFQQKGVSAYPLTQAVRFCSLLPMRTIPAKVIILMGMEEGEFPRKDPKSSLDSMRMSKNRAWMPSQVDYDRYLMIDALLSASDYLIFTYSAEQKSPSRLLDELFSCLDSAYRVNGEKPSTFCCFQHPFEPFDKSYFDGTLKSYSQRNYRLACAQYGAGDLKRKQVRVPVEEQGIEEEIFVNLAELLAHARHPIRYHLNRVMGLYIHEKERRQLEEDEPFALDPKWRGWILKEALYSPVEAVLEKAERRGILPEGRFGERIRDEIREEVERRGMVPIESTIEISRRYSEKVWVEGKGWKCPPYEIELGTGQRVNIEGVIPFSESSQIGLYGEGSTADLVKHYPLLLFYPLFGVDGEIVMTKSGKVFPLPKGNLEEKLQHYLTYYLESQKKLSLMMPEWFEAYVNRDVGALAKAIDCSLGEGFFSSSDPYVQWVYEQGIDPQRLIEEWSEKGIDLFGEVYEEWF